MVDQATAALIADDIPFLFGFPNQNSFEYLVRVMDWIPMGNLDFYVLPLRLGTFKPAWRWANPLCGLAAAGFVALPRPARPPLPGRAIRKVDSPAFRAHRYGPTVRQLGLPGGATCFLRLYTEAGGVRTAYILDVIPLVPSSFLHAVRASFRALKREADIIMYVGTPTFKPPGLIRLPRSKEPKLIRMCGKILLPDQIDKQIIDISAWELNIANIDVR
jgi:hypothetical protein